MQELYIESTAQLNELCERLHGNPWLALDTEFMREKTYYPQFCLLQVSNGKIAACVDPLAIDDLKPLRKLIYDPSAVKVFHAGRQDLEIFHYLWGQLPQPLFDTQLAATLLGMGDQVGYGNLVQKLLGHTLEKGHTRTDWSRRPLHPDQRRYALDDVIFLGEIYQKMHQQLEQKGRSEWLQADFALLADPATYKADTANLWQRVKGCQHLKGAQLAVLRALSSWREEEARRANKPKRWIVKDEVLLELARHQPEEIGQLERVRALEPGTIKRQGTALLKLIAEARQLPREQWPTGKQPPPRLSTNQEAMADLLICSLRLLAEQQHITPSALASRKDLERLITGERDLNILQGWRGMLAGGALLEVLEGRSAPQIREGRLVLSKSPGHGLTA